MPPPRACFPLQESGWFATVTTRTRYALCVASSRALLPLHVRKTLPLAFYAAFAHAALLLPTTHYPHTYALPRFPRAARYAHPTRGGGRRVCVPFPPPGAIPPAFIVYLPLPHLLYHTTDCYAAVLTLRPPAGRGGVTPTPHYYAAFAHISHHTLTGVNHVIPAYRQSSNRVAPAYEGIVKA